MGDVGRFCLGVGERKGGEVGEGEGGEVGKGKGKGWGGKGNEQGEERSRVREGVEAR